MTIVDGYESLKTIKRINEEAKNEISDEGKQEFYTSQVNDRTGNTYGEVIHPDIYFWNEKNMVKRGYYMDSVLKKNLDDYFIKGVMKKWDAVMLITGLEGSGKSNSAMGVAKYCDPTFPGKLLNDGTTRRRCERVVFTQHQFEQAVYEARPGQAIVWDEMVLGGLAQDAATDAQKALIKLMTTIRKKRLFLFFVIPSMFMLRMYFAVFRTRTLLHFFSPDGITRGSFKLYSYDKKRELYMKGRKEFNMNAAKPDYIGNSTNLTGLFFDNDEYETKKDAAIRQISDKNDPKKKKELALKTKQQRDILLYYIHNMHRQSNNDWNFRRYSEWLKASFGDNMKMTAQALKNSGANAIKGLGLNEDEIPVD